MPSSGDQIHPSPVAPGGAFHAESEALITVDEQQRIVMINPAAQRMFGVSADQALSTPLARFIPERHRAAHDRLVREFAHAAVAEKSRRKRGAIVGVRANGEEFPAEASISRMDVVGDFGTRRYFTVLLNDLSAESSIKAQLERLKRSMRQVFELVPAAIWITDGDEIVFANRACEELFGAQGREALVGRSMYSLLHVDSHRSVRHKIAQALATDRPLPMLRERIARLDGAMRDVVIAVAGLPDHGQTAVQMIISDITEHERENAEVARSRHELRRLSASLVDAREEERRRIARELHDELGQRLTALKMELSTLATHPQAGALGARITAMLDMVDETVASVRRIATDLRPLMLDDLGLNAAIEWLANSWARRMGIAVTLRLGKADPPVSEAASIALYRMVQEALTNIARHAHASAVQIEIRRQLNELVLTVQDNGVGFPEPLTYPEGSHGLMGLRERAYMLGGELEIDNATGGGGRISVRLPMLASGWAEPSAKHLQSAGGRNPGTGRGGRSGPA
jgi:two-component system, NarL family, sensor histidine kinase UhpB